MLKLKSIKLCENCPTFDPVAMRDKVSDGKKTICNTTIICQHIKHCQGMYDFLSSYFKENPNSKATNEELVELYFTEKETK